MTTEEKGEEPSLKNHHCGSRMPIRRLAFPVVRREATGLASGGFADFGGFAVFADEGDERLGGAGKAAVATIDEAEFAPDPAGN
jgi:hypothetical protein